MPPALDTAELTWIRRLATRLVQDAANADELTQDVALAALRTPHHDITRRRAWIAGVAKRLAVRQIRDRARRARRERCAARTDVAPATDELVARAEIAARIATEARRLPEPFRHTILLHFLDERDLASIAAHDGVPADTARWRLRRGLQLLRARLAVAGPNGRDWRPLALLLTSPSGAGRPLAAPTAAAGIAGVALPLIIKKLFAIAGVLAIGSVGVFVLRPAAARPNVPPPSPVRSAAAPDAAPVIAAEQAPDRSASASRAPVPPRSAATPSDRAGASALRGRVLDLAGRPIGGATVYLLRTDSAPPNRSARRVEHRVTTSADGQFRLAPPAPDRWPVTVLGAVANGYLRQVIDCTALDPAEPVEFRLDPGRSIRGRVVDEFGRAIAELAVLAHSSPAPIEHVSLTRVRQRAEIALLAGPGSTFAQHETRSDAAGTFVLSGLTPGPLELRSLEPDWTVISPPIDPDRDPEPVWIARRTFGVRLIVEDGSSGDPVDRVGATFRIDARFADGRSGNFGQWTAAGPGTVELAWTPELLPPLADTPLVHAAVHGTATVGSATVEWAAPERDDPIGITGVVEVRLRIGDPTTPGSPPPAEPVPVALLVRDSAGQLLDSPLAVRWSTAGNGHSGTTTANSSRPGRYLVDLPGERLELRIHEFGASGSLDDWTGDVVPRRDRAVPVDVVLPRGGRVRLLRPSDADGEWFVTAQWRPSADAPWRGSWTYSSSGEALDLAALRPAEWRFEIRAAGIELGARTARVRAGDRLTVGR